MNHHAGLLIKCLVRNPDVGIDLSEFPGALLVGASAATPDVCPSPDNRLSHPIMS